MTLGVAGDLGRPSTGGASITSYPLYANLPEGATEGAEAFAQKIQEADPVGPYYLKFLSGKWDPRYSGAMLSYIQSHPIPAGPVGAPTNNFVVSSTMTLRDYDSSTLNGDGGTAVWRGVLITKWPHGRTHNKVRLLIGAVNEGYTPDRYRVAVAQGGWTTTPAGLTELAYPDALAYYQPPVPAAYGKISGAWLEHTLTPVGFDTPITWSVEGAGLGRWTGGANSIATNWVETAMAYNQYMDAAGTLTAGFTESVANVSFGLLAWEYEVTGDPIYGVGVLGDSTFTGIRPLGSLNEICTEGTFHYANLDETANNGMRWMTSNWGNGAYTMDDYIARGQSILSILSGKIQFLVVQAWTYNQSPNSLAGAQAQQVQLLAFKALAEAAGIKVIFAILNPQGTYRQGAGYDEGYDAQVAFVTAQSGFNVSSHITGDPRQFNPLYSEDGVHTNAAGVAVQGPYASSALTGAMIAAGATL